MLVLRDGKKLIGVLRSWDQFGMNYDVNGNTALKACFTANLVLQDTIERVFLHDVYADLHRGVFLVRGENVLLLGEIV